MQTMNSYTYVPSMPDISISQSGIHHLLTTLIEHEASKLDRISPYILKHCANEITPLLYVLFNQSLSTSLLPNDWLKVNICPVYKKGNYSNVTITIDLYH